MTWNPFKSDELFCSLEDGLVVCIDRRKADVPLFSFQAHEKTTSSLSFSSFIPGMLATASVDKVGFRKISYHINSGMKYCVRFSLLNI